VQVGIEPIAAHLYVLYFGMMSMITPPDRHGRLRRRLDRQGAGDGDRLGGDAFGWSAYVIPFLFVFSPTLLLIGAPLEIALAIVTAVMGVWLVSAALAGYFARGSRPLMRGLFVAFRADGAGSGRQLPGAVYSDIVGVVGGVLSDAAGLRARHAGRSGGRRQVEEQGNSLERVLAVLEVFTEDRLEWTPEELMQELGYSRPTLYRYLKTLKEAGLLSLCPMPASPSARAWSRWIICCASPIRWS
jgi:hypothetical protein